jgi:GNAT superfamily N-acetyltransferase
MPTIRELRFDEIPATTDYRRAMILEVDGEDLDESIPGWRERFVTFLEEYLRAGSGAVWVAENEGGIVGTAAAYKPATHRSQIYRRPSAYIFNVYVAPAWRRKGIGRALTLEAVEWARVQGCSVVRLRTSSMGRPVYESVGFRQSDEMELPL